MIGRRPPSYDDPVAVLIFHHANARRAAQALLAALAAGKDALPAVQTALEFFLGPAARHHEDEEHSVFPRLDRSPALDELCTDHRALEAIVLSLKTIAGRLPDDPAVAAELPVHAQALEAALAAHHAREEAEVFPAARALPPPELRAIGLEMRIRRGGEEPR